MNSSITNQHPDQSGCITHHTMKRNTIYAAGAFISTLSSIYCLSIWHTTGFILFLIPVAMFCGATERGAHETGQGIAQDNTAQDRNQQ